MAKSNLGAEGGVGESGVVNSFRERGFTAGPMSAGVEGEPQPTVEIIGDAGGGTAGIPFQAAGQGEQRSGEFAVYGGAGIKDGVSAEKLPLRRGLVLSGREGGKRKQDSDHCRKHCQATGKAAL